MTNFDDGSRTMKTAEVSKYLRENPSFFADNPAVLTDLFVPHNVGAATSLVELQISALRKENRKLKREMTDIVQIARENDSLSAKLHALSLKLIGLGSSREILTNLDQALLSDFEADHVRTMLFFREGGETGEALREEESEGPNDGRNFFQTIIDNGVPECGELDSSLATFVFGEEAVVGSGVLLPLVGESWDGVVVIGSKNADRYNKEMGTEFLVRMIELLVGLLDYHQRKSRQGFSEAVSEL